MLMQAACLSHLWRPGPASPKATSQPLLRSLIAHASSTGFSGPAAYRLLPFDIFADAERRCAGWQPCSSLAMLVGTGEGCLDSLALHSWD